MLRKKVCFYFLILMFPLGALALDSGRPVCVKVNNAEIIYSMEPPSSKLISKSAKKNKRNLQKAEVPENSINKYTPLFWPGDKKNGWIQVHDVRKKKFWIRRADVSTKLKCVTVRVRKSLARKGPGDDFPMDELIEQGVGFLDLNSLEDGWVKVKSPKGKMTWINLDHIWRPSNLFEMKFSDEKISGDPE